MQGCIQIFFCMCVGIKGVGVGGSR